MVFLLKYTRNLLRIGQAADWLSTMGTPFARTHERIVAQASSEVEARTRYDLETV